MNAVTEERLKRIFDLSSNPPDVSDFTGEFRYAQAHGALSAVLEEIRDIVTRELGKETS